MNDNFWLAFGLTVLAGLSTGIGSLIALLAKKTNTRFLAISLGFSAGVMIYVSMTEIFFKAQQSLQGVLGEKQGSIATVVAFFAGMFIIGVIDNLIPQKNNPHEVKKVETDPTSPDKEGQLMRTGLFTALALAIHNFPEGMATFVSALHEPSLAIPIALAIALHNIPEGIAVSVPIFYATGDKKKAFLYSFASGLAEPIGAILGYFLLMPFMSNIVYGLLFAGVAGIMVFISLDELLPSSREYGDHHLSIYGLMGGMVFMAISLLVL